MDEIAIASKPTQGLDVYDQELAVWIRRTHLCRHFQRNLSSTPMKLLVMCLSGRHRESIWSSPCSYLAERTDSFSLVSSDFMSTMLSHYQGHGSNFGQHIQSAAVSNGGKPGKRRKRSARLALLISDELGSYLKHKIPDKLHSLEIDLLLHIRGLCLLY
jgi:hypothetical protein